MAYSEELMLPSRGIIYRMPDFDGVVKVRPFTTKSYKALITGNASEIALKQFIDDCLVDCPIKSKNMNQNDLMAILFKTRVMTLGNKIKTQVRCPDCSNVSDLEWDLNEIEIKYLYVEEYPIKVVLPNSRKEICVRFKTGFDYIKAKQEADRRAATFKMKTSDFLPIYNMMSLIDVDGKDIIEKAEWYESLNPQDAIFIEEVLTEIDNSFGIKMTREEHCPVCDRVFTTYIDIGSDFFRPYTNFSLGITSKAGNLAGAPKEPDISE